MVLPRIDYKAVKFLKKNPVMVLRSAHSHIALNVSYSIKGLKWSCDRHGRSLYFSNGVIREGRIDSTDGLPLTPRKDVYVQKFIPMDHESVVIQAAEFAAVKKAYKLLYGIGEHFSSKQGNIE